MNCVPQKGKLKFYPLVLVNVTLFENRAFIDIIKLRYGHSRLGWPLNPMTSVLISKGRFGHRDTDAHRQ